jgi:hypothetical protein
MKHLAAALLLVPALGGCASSPGSSPVCGDHGTLLAHTTQVATSINLKVRSDKPMLYVISNHYVVLLPSKDVTDLLQSWSSNGGSPYAPALRALLAADIPLSDDTDLHKYSIKDTRIESLPRYIAATLLEAGKASVVDLWRMNTEKHLSSVTMVTLANDGVWRDFCEPTGESILFVTDVIQ